jgi:hypothetical protein
MVRTDCHIDRRRYVGPHGHPAGRARSNSLRGCSVDGRYAVDLAGTVAEALIVADRRGCGQEMRRLIDGLGFDVSPVTPAAARAVADAYACWGTASARQA